MSAASDPMPVPLERAQLVWRRAVQLARPPGDDGRFTGVLDLLRTARHGPATMLHALTLGRAQLDASPDDASTADAVRLLARSIAWLGRPPEEGEVGTARSPDQPDQPGVGREQAANASGQTRTPGPAAER